MNRLGYTRNIVIFALTFVCSSRAAAESFSTERAGFSVNVKGEQYNYKISPLFTLPSEIIKFEVPHGSKCQSNSGTPTKTYDTSCEWLAPVTPGNYKVNIASGNSEISFQIFVMHPYSELNNGQLNGYRIGDYPSPSLIKNIEYRLPRGFIEVTPENKETLLTPHFRLEQFLCKQQGTFPKYIVLREQLLLKLEGILEEINRHGINTSTFVVMSGYRTPYYNQIIENVRYSRHVFGDAADVYLPHRTAADYKKHGYREITLLSKLVNKLEQRPIFRRFIGGMGIYNHTATHPPFLHVDVRGHSARW